MTMKGYEDGYVLEGDLLEIHGEFVKLVGCRFCLVIEHYKASPPPLTHLKRSIAVVYKPNGTIGKVPFSFIKEVIRINDKRARKIH